jgi:hypothetical protein
MGYQQREQTPSQIRKKLERDVYENEVFEVKTAVRHRTPVICSIWGPQFSGKTYSAIMLAAGLVEPGEKVGFIDTENGRGSMYADDPDVRRLLPQGYRVIELHPPFHPMRYIRANQQLVSEGCSLVITDSGSHAWEGDGGAQDIKEEDKGWNNAKLWTKRYKAALVYSPAHQVVCLRAQEKTKVVGTGKDQEYVPLGVQPICEKSFPYDMTVAFEVEGEIDGKPATHLARPKKWVKAMDDLFANWQPQLLTPAVGRRIREWNNGGASEDSTDRLRKNARAAATTGMTAYKSFFGALTAAEKRILTDLGDHETNKRTAEETDNPSHVEPDPEVDAKFFGDVKQPVAT